MSAGVVLYGGDPTSDHVSADGKRVLVTDRIADDKPLAIHVAHNWFEEFRDRK